MHGQQLVDEAAAFGEPTMQLPAAGAAGRLDLFEADRLVGDLRADGSADEPVTVEDATLGEVAGVVADGDRFADVGGQGRV